MASQIDVKNSKIVFQEMLSNEASPNTSFFAETMEQQNRRKLLICLGRGTMPVPHNLDLIGSLQFYSSLHRSIKNRFDHGTILFAQFKIEDIVKTSKKGTYSSGFRDKFPVF